MGRWSRSWTVVPVRPRALERPRASRTGWARRTARSPSSRRSRRRRPASRSSSSAEIRHVRRRGLPVEQDRGSLRRQQLAEHDGRPQFRVGPDEPNRRPDPAARRGRTRRSRRRRPSSDHRRPVTVPGGADGDVPSGSRPGTSRTSGPRGAARPLCSGYRSSPTRPIVSTSRGPSATSSLGAVSPRHRREPGQAPRRRTPGSGGAVFTSCCSSSTALRISGSSAATRWSSWVSVSSSAPPCHHLDQLLQAHLVFREVPEHCPRRRITKWSPTG